MLNVSRRRSIWWLWKLRHYEALASEREELLIIMRPEALSINQTDPDGPGEMVNRHFCR